MDFPVVFLNVFSMKHQTTWLSYRVAILEHARTTGCNDSQAGRVETGGFNMHFTAIKPCVH